MEFVDQPEMGYGNSILHIAAALDPSPRYWRSNTTNRVRHLDGIRSELPLHHSAPDSDSSYSRYLTTRGPAAIRDDSLGTEMGHGHSILSIAAALD